MFGSSGLLPSTTPRRLSNGNQDHSPAQSESAKSSSAHSGPHLFNTAPYSLDQMPFYRLISLPDTQHEFQPIRGYRKF